MTVAICHIILDYKYDCLLNIILLKKISNCIFSKGHKCQVTDSFLSPHRRTLEKHFCNIVGKMEKKSIKFNL